MKTGSKLTLFKISIYIFLLTFFLRCFPEYRIPFNAGIVDIKHTSRGESNFYYPSRSDQNSNVVGPGKLLKQGKSCSSSVIYVDQYIFIKGGSIRSAAASADISQIGAVEYSLFSFFGLYVKECIIVWGE